MISDMRLWILEDDPGARFVYEETLGYRYPVVFFENLESLSRALHDGQKEKPDLLIADLKLPDGTFLAFLKSPDGALIDFPFAVVSSVDDLDALRFCFERGAVDYIVKPFQKSELIAKTERALAHGTPITPAGFQSAIDNLPLTGMERTILLKIHDAGPGGIERGVLISRVWKDVAVNPKTVDVHISNLRRKLAPHNLDVRATGNGRYTLIRVGETSQS
jgi:DNA-binding response OmpR family regulator